MFPYFIIFGKMITTYFLLALIGAFVAGVFACVLARKRGLDDNNIIIILLFSAVGAILGGHILYGITNIKLIPEIFNSHNFSELTKNLQAVFGGAVFYGGL
ncbi:MAG: prolipoprotein diacylglyceryl transferase, partial [Clostridia bacterium]|nr:prolipoprotein diacylglyceryl transferase [Clostridia bacterium]